MMTSPAAAVRRPLESRPEDGSATTLVVEHTTGTQYVATVRGHQVRVDQPLTGGGTDEAPTPSSCSSPRWRPAWPISQVNTSSATA
jgi:hypothetical protein